jgi:hypothetical protein
MRPNKKTSMSSPTANPIDPVRPDDRRAGFFMPTPELVAEHGGGPYLAVLIDNNQSHGETTLRFKIRNGDWDEYDGFVVDRNPMTSVSLAPGTFVFWDDYVKHVDYKPLKMEPVAMGPVTIESVEDVIEMESYFECDLSGIVICTLTMTNGAFVTGEGRGFYGAAGVKNDIMECKSPAMEEARLKAFEKAWELESYLHNHYSALEFNKHF